MARFVMTVIAACLFRLNPSTADRAADDTAGQFRYLSTPEREPRTLVIRMQHSPAQNYQNRDINFSTENTPGQPSRTFRQRKHLHHIMLNVSLLRQGFLSTFFACR